MVTHSYNRLTIHWISVNSFLYVRSFERTTQHVQRTPYKLVRIDVTDATIKTAVISSGIFFVRKYSKISIVFITNL